MKPGRNARLRAAGGFLCLLTIVFSNVLGAQSLRGRDARPPQPPAERGWRLPPDEAAAIARRRSGGRVLGIQRGETGKPPGYRVRVLTPDGRVRGLWIDAERGRGD